METPFTMLAMNAFIYVVPVYCLARAIVDRRENRRLWSALGAVCAAILILPLLSAYIFPASQLAWFFLGVLVFGSVAIALFCFARAFVDLRERRYIWALPGVLSAGLLLLPHVVTFSAPVSRVTVG